MNLKGKAIIAQGGGPTAVINQSLVGTIFELRRFPAQVTQIWGAIHGIHGIINESFFNLAEAHSQHLESIALTPSAALGTTRDKPNVEYCRHILEVFQKYNVRYFFYIGGNDSASAVQLIQEQAQQSDYKIHMIHIPKTIDNDLVITDHCPGYPSAACFVANAFAGLDADNRALLGVNIVVVMGRHTGWLTAASTLARRNHDDGPHLIYFPEQNFSLEQYLTEVTEIYSKYNRCVIAVSEGIWMHNSVGKVPFIADILHAQGKQPEVDDYGNIQLSGSLLAEKLARLIKTECGIKRVHGDTLGYIQRSFPAVVSNIDALEARAVGKFAAQYACRYGKSGSIIIRRDTNNHEYNVNYDIVDINAVAAKIKYMPFKFIKSDDYNNEFKKYLWPLVKDYIPNMEWFSVPKI